MECKKCNQSELYEVEKTNINGDTYITVYCKLCNGYIKHGAIDHIKDESKGEIYKQEHMANEDATEKQIWYIRKVVKYQGIIGSKLHASNIINDYKKRYDTTT